MNNLLLIQTKLNEQAKKNNVLKYYESRHVKAWRRSSIAKMIDALAIYADEHFKRYKSPVGEDYVLGEYWIESLKGVRGLLNGELIDLDAGFTDMIIITLAENNGFNDALEFKK